MVTAIVRLLFSLPCPYLAGMKDAASLALDRRLARVIEANRHGRDAQAEPRNRSPWLPALQRWQAARLKRSFVDFLAQPRTEPAARFFLDDLYGDYDVTTRDRNVERVLPLMRKLLPAHLIETAADAIELAWLSHAFDLRMAEQLERLSPRVGKLDEACTRRPTAPSASRACARTRSISSCASAAPSTKPCTNRGFRACCEPRACLRSWPGWAPCRPSSNAASRPSRNCAAPTISSTPSPRANCAPRSG